MYHTLHLTIQTIRKGRAKSNDDTSPIQPINQKHQPDLDSAVSSLAWNFFLVPHMSFHEKNSSGVTNCQLFTVGLLAN